ncbi:hypothetical protein HYQ46_012292 [Verticillium longisporum]|nr:hypothetical protein HYQ44_010882 [Verticillium longisporum]KAG7151890.1 hypothetical protein HYQ46_012292 [Verticillium longisporum]
MCRTKRPGEEEWQRKSEVWNRVVQSQGVGVGDGAEKLASSSLQGQAAGDVSRGGLLSASTGNAHWALGVRDQLGGWTTVKDRQS